MDGITAGRVAHLCYIASSCLEASGVGAQHHNVCTHCLCSLGIVFVLVCGGLGCMAFEVLMSLCCEGVLEKRQKAKEKGSIYARDRRSMKQYALHEFLPVSHNLSLLFRSRGYIE
jgi:hypothetical protein